jgi:hypothetical protein
MFSFVPISMRAILFARTVGANEKHLLTFGSTRRLRVTFSPEWRGTQTVTERSAKPLFGGSIPSRASTLPPLHACFMTTLQRWGNCISEFLLKQFDRSLKH